MRGSGVKGSTRSYLWHFNSKADIFPEYQVERYPRPGGQAELFADAVFHEELEAECGQFIFARCIVARHANVRDSPTDEFLTELADAGQILLNDLPGRSRS